MAFEKLRKMLAERLGVSEDKIKPESHLVGDLGLDSLDYIELLMDLEEDFGIAIPDEEAKKLTTVQSVVDLINSHLQ